jgi:hypothetical protein
MGVLNTAWRLLQNFPYPGLQESIAIPMNILKLGELKKPTTLYMSRIGSYASCVTGWESLSGAKLVTGLGWRLQRTGALSGTAGRLGSAGPVSSPCSFRPLPVVSGLSL